MPPTLTERILHHRREVPARIARRLRSAGLVPGNRDYTRFVVVGPARSGTNLMIITLGRHPAILCDGELYHANPRIAEFLRPGCSRVVRDPETIRLRDEEPAEFFRRLVFPPVSGGIRAVGFKLLHGHFRRKRWAASFELLRADRNLKVILLSRRHSLEKLVSVRLAKSRRQWRVEEGKEVRGTGDQPLVRFETDFLEERFQSFEDADFRMREMWAGHPVHEIAYEDLIDDFEGGMNSIQEFLDVPVRPLAAGTQKMTLQRPSELIENFGELKDHFAGTKWSRFFDGAP